MEEDDIVELSSDSPRCEPAFDYDFNIEVFPTQGENSQSGHAGSLSPNSLDDCFPSGSDGEGTPPSSQIHGISSSEDEEPAQTQVDCDSGLGSQYEALDKVYYSSQLSQGKEEERAAREAERERKKTEKHLANIERLRQREEKRRKREELNQKKQYERQLKKQQAFKRNQMKPNECLKYMTVIVDEKLFRTVLCSKAMEIFPHPAVKFNFKHQPIENSITWTRSQLDGSCSEEEWAAVMWQGEDVAQAIAESQLVSKFKHISQTVFPGKTVILLIFAMDLYHRKRQNAMSYQARKATQMGSDENMENSSQAKNKFLTREEVELGLVELQILAGVCHRHFDDSADFADVLGQFTRAIAEVPYKREREEIDKEMGWHARSFNKNCVRANKDMQGLDKLWIQHLTVFTNLNIDIAKAIVSFYPTPTTLIEAYENCTSQSEKERLLQNIQVKRSGSTSAVIRRIGPELSKKICLTFTETDGNVKLSSKK